MKHYRVIAYSGAYDELFENEKLARSFASQHHGTVFQWQVRGGREMWVQLDTYK